MKEKEFLISLTRDELCNLIAACDYYFERVSKVYQECFPCDELPNADEFVIVHACDKLKKLHESFGDEYED